MRIFLLLISLLAGIAGVRAQDAATAVRRYDFTMSSPQGDVTGLLVARLADDGDVNASVINPFGFSAIDFSYNAARNKVKLNYVVSFLDSWRVKYVLKRDLTVLMALLTDSGRPVPSRYNALGSGDGLTLTNTRYGLSYSVKPLETDRK
ncbi:MAG: hypothetical protein K2N28_04310 [Muribaculaceae bacterium]|nr:hypothetical protein [Muribaculaceae bacterium]